MSVSEPSFMSLSNPEDQKKLFNVVRECSNSLTRIQGEREYIKEAIGSICKELNLSKSLVNKIVRTYFMMKKLQLQKNFNNSMKLW